MVYAAHEWNLLEFVVLIVLFDAEIVDPAVMNRGKTRADNLLDDFPTQ
jgi:hypothetical protein